MSGTGSEEHRAPEAQEESEDASAQIADLLGLAGAIARTIREGLLVLDLDLHVRAANEPFYRMVGVRPEDTLGRRVYDIGNGQWDLPELRRLFENVLPREGSVEGYEVEYVAGGLGRRCVVLNARRLAGLILLAVEDATERREDERELGTSRERFRLFLENAAEYAIFAMDPESRIEMWSPSAERILGWREAEALGQPAALIFTEEDRAAGEPEREMAEALRRGSAVDERWHVRRDGSRFWASGTLVALREEGRVRGFVKILRDNTARKKAEEALRASEERYRTLFATMDQGYGVLEAILGADGRPVDFRFVETNPAFEQQTGLADAAGRTALAFVPALEDAWIEAFERVTATGEPERVELAALRRWFDVYVSRVGGPESRRVALLFTDITARREAEEARRESERRLRALFRQAPAFVAVVRGPEHRFEFVNPAYLQLVGSRDLLGRPIREALSDLEGRGLFEVIDQVYREGRPHSAADVALVLQREGDAAERRFVDFVCQPLREDDGAVSGVMAIGVDVTERVQAREALYRSNRELERRVEARTRQVRALSRALALAEQRERQRIAQVLHDELQQTLFGAKVSAALGNTAQLGAMLDEALALTRSLSQELSPPLLQGDDLEDLLRWTAEQVAERHGLEVEVEAGPDIPQLEPDLLILLSRLLRELLFNVAKHAGTRRARRGRAIRGPPLPRRRGRGRRLRPGRAGAPRRVRAGVAERAGAAGARERPAGGDLGAGRGYARRHHGAHRDRERGVGARRWGRALRSWAKLVVRRNDLARTLWACHAVPDLSHISEADTQRLASREFHLGFGFSSAFPTAARPAAFWPGRDDGARRNGISSRRTVSLRPA